MSADSKTLRDALETLNGAGLYQQASELALKHARRESKAQATTTAPTRPGGITAEDLAKSPTERGYLTHAELRAADTDQMYELQTKHPDVFAKSMQMLSATKGL
jgi:hypothetical protein